MQYNMVLRTCIEKMKRKKYNGIKVVWDTHKSFRRCYLIELAQLVRALPTNL